MVDNFKRYYGKPHWPPNSAHIIIPRFFEKNSPVRRSFPAQGEFILPIPSPGVFSFSSTRPTCLEGGNENDGTGIQETGGLLHGGTS